MGAQVLLWTLRITAHQHLSYDKAAIVATIICLGLCIIAWKLDTIKAFRWKHRLAASAVVVVATLGQSFFLHQGELF